VEGVKLIYLGQDNIQWQTFVSVAWTYYKKVGNFLSRWMMITCLFCAVQILLVLCTEREWVNSLFIG